MAIFRYTLFKYIKAPSTWVILLCSMFIAGFLGGYLPMSALDTSKSGTVAQKYAMLIMAIGGGITTFLAIFMSVFAGFKGASMFRDEVEDGTFLVMLSKPQTRGKIIFQKWLALQTLMLGYSFLSIASFVVFVEIFDKGDTIPSLASIGIGTLKDNVFKMGGFIWAVLIVIGLIFSSIAILLSTRLSAAATVGISISLGIIIPITGMVSMFTAKDEYKGFQASSFSRMGMMLDTTSKLSDDEMISLVSSITEQQIGSGKDETDVKNAVIKFKDGIRALLKDMDVAYKKIDNPQSIYNTQVSTGEKDSFKSIWPLDLNYQLRQMSTTVTNNMIPDALKPQIKKLKSSGIAGINFEQKVTGHPSFAQGQATQWVHDQLKGIMETEMKWGIAAKDIIWNLIDFIGVKDTDTGKKVDSDQVLYSILTGARIPNNWNIDKRIKNYLKQDLVKTTLTLIFNAIYHPMYNVFSESELSQIVPDNYGNYFVVAKDPKDNGKLASKADEYKNLYKTTVLSLTKDSRIFSENFIPERAKAQLIRDKVTPAISTLGADGKVSDTDIAADQINHDNYWMISASDDKKVYNELMYIAYTNPSSFVNIKTVDYMPGMTLLYIYLGLALFLVPVSFLIVRREDFR